MTLRRRRAGRAGPIVYRWDLDKTYLRTEFDTVRQLLRVPFERPEDKVDVPGVVELIGALKPCARATRRDARIYFLSASPPQIGKAIRAKLALDGVPYDGIVFKNQLHYLVRGKFSKLREQVGFKLTELLRSRQGLSPDTEEVLFGDDGESDAITYSVYADVVAGHMDLNTLRAILARLRVDPRLAAEALTLASAVRSVEAVRRIFVNLERRTPPANFRRLGERVVPTFNYLQTAAVLCADGYLDLAAVVRVARSLADRAGYTRQRLANSLADLRRRGHLDAAHGIAVRRALQEAGLVPAVAPARLRVGWRDRARARLEQARSAWRRRMAVRPVSVTTGPVDYDAVIAYWEQLQGAAARGEG